MEIRLKDYIEKTIQEIKEGLPHGYIVEESIDFEVSLTTTTNKKGGIEIKVFTGGIDREKESVHTVNFSVVHEETKQKSEIGSAELILQFVTQAFSNLNDLSTNENAGKELIQQPTRKTKAKKTR